MEAYGECLLCLRMVKMRAEKIDLHIEDSNAYSKASDARCYFVMKRVCML